MPEETKKESEVPFNFEEGVSTIFSKDKESGESGLSPAEDARLNLKRELSDDKKSITKEVAQATKKGAKEIRESRKKGTPLSARDIRERLEIGSRIDSVKEDLGYEDTKAQLEKVKEMIKSGYGGPIRGVVSPIKGVDEPILNPDKDEEGEAPISDKDDDKSALGEGE